MKKTAVLFLITASIVLTACSNSGYVESVSESGTSATIESSDESVTLSSDNSESSDNSTTLSSDNSKNISSTTELSSTTALEKPKTKLVNDEDIKIDTENFKVGGYLPVTADERYKNNGLKYPNNNNGILFREGEEEDLYNWVAAGYTKWRREDVRIASRKGGEDNPRIATYLSLDNSDEELLNANDAEYCMVTVMKEKYNADNNDIPDDLRELFEKFIPNGNKEEGRPYAETYQEIMEYIDAHDLEKELNLFAGEGDGKNVGTFNTFVNYNCRNYCGDTISISIDGEGTVKSNIDPSGKSSRVFAAAGVDYILTCDDDPTAFKLVKDDELKSMYEAICVQRFDERVCSSYNANATYTDPSLDGSQRLYHQAYVGIKPGIYRCTVMIPTTGDKFPIVIETLPLYYKTGTGGCYTQEAIDFCVQHMHRIIKGQYFGWGNSFGVNNCTATYEDKLEAVKEFNSRNYRTFEEESIQLNYSEEAAEWISHLPCVSYGLYDYPSNLKYYAINNWISEHGPSKDTLGCQSYYALNAIMDGANDCESLTSLSQCMLTVTGYTTRVVIGGHHMFLEAKVPASITKSGKDQWLMVDNSHYTGDKTGYMKKEYCYKEVEGFDTFWWSMCYNPDIPREEPEKESEPA